jgi:hypothetical protein
MNDWRAKKLSGYRSSPCQPPPDTPFVRLEGAGKATSHKNRELFVANCGKRETIRVAASGTLFTEGTAAQDRGTGRRYRPYLYSIPIRDRSCAVIAKAEEGSEGEEGVQAMVVPALAGPGRMYSLLRVFGASLPLSISRCPLVFVGRGTVPVTICHTIRDFG